MRERDKVAGRRCSRERVFEHWSARLGCCLLCDLYLIPPPSRLSPRRLLPTQNSFFFSPATSSSAAATIGRDAIRRRCAARAVMHFRRISSSVRNPRRRVDCRLDKAHLSRGTKPTRAVVPVALARSRARRLIGNARADKVERCGGCARASLVRSRLTPSLPASSPACLATRI